MTELVPVTTLMSGPSAVAPGALRAPGSFAKGMDLERRAGRCLQKQVVWWVRVSRRNCLAGMQQELWFRDILFAHCSHRRVSEVPRSTQVSG